MAFIVSTAEIYVDVYENVYLMVKETRQQIFHLLCIIQFLILRVNSEFFYFDVRFKEIFKFYICLPIVNDYGESAK